MPFVQEFEFVPTSQFRGQLDELEILFFPDEDGVDLLLQIDRKARGLAGLFAEATGTDESFVRVRFERHELDATTTDIAGTLADLIRDYV
ncbi:Sporulation-control protein spo0M [compost metagenome]